MTKKHFKRFVEIIGKNWNKEDFQRWNNLVDDMMCYFQEENPLFDRDRFMNKPKYQIRRNRARPGHWLLTSLMSLRRRKENERF